MGRFAVLLCGFLAGSAWLPRPADAADVAWLYEVEVPVADQSADARLAASKQALLIVIKRVSGLADVPMSATVTGALQASQRYYSEYHYRTDTGVAGAANNVAKKLLLSVRFNEGAVQKLVTDAGLPLWSANRPITIAWITVDDAGRRTALGASDTHALLTGLRDRASERGLPLVLPETNADGAAYYAALWNGTPAALDSAAARYGADRIAMGRVAHDANGAWRAEWQLVAGTDRQNVSLQSPSPEAAGAAIVDRLADTLVTRYAVSESVQQRMDLQIEGIDGVAQYGALLKYLRGLAFVDAVQIEEVRSNTIRLTLATRTSWERMQDLLSLDRRLEPSEAPAEAADRRVLIWRGDRP